jgi:hypothetical protein
MKAQYPRKRRRKRKCKCCGELYMPDARHFHDQNYCGKAECRMVSKKVSQHRWLISPKGAEYRDPEEIKRRVREWRKEHPKYWRRTGKGGRGALRETKSLQVPDEQLITASLDRGALQDMTFAQPALLVGLIASLTGTALQETIAETSRRYVLLGQDILGKGSGISPKGGRRDGKKTHSVSRTGTSRAPSIQLGRSSPGAGRTYR